MLTHCETENDFWPNARYFFDVGEAELAFEGMFIYLLSRDDLWNEHHSLIKRIQGRLSKHIDFDQLELSVLDDGRYCEKKAVIEWREAIASELDEG